MFVLQTGYLLVRDESTVVESISLYLACNKKMLMMMMIVVIIMMMMMIMMIMMMMCGVSRQTMDGMMIDRRIHMDTLPTFIHPRDQRSGIGLQLLGPPIQLM